MQPARATSAFASNLTPAPFGQCGQFTGAVRPGSGGPATGTITFFDGTTSLGTANITNNIGTLSSCGLQGGAHTVTAKYNGDPNYIASTSTTLAETVNPAASTATIASAQNPATFGSGVLLTATLRRSVRPDVAVRTVT